MSDIKKKEITIGELEYRLLLSNQHPCNDSHREMIRDGYIRMAEFQYAKGDFVAAVQSFRQGLMKDDYFKTLLSN